MCSRGWLAAVLYCFTHTAASAGCSFERLAEVWVQLRGRMRTHRGSSCNLLVHSLLLLLRRTAASAGGSV